MVTGATIAAATIFGASPAAAATPAEICGSGYVQIDSQTLTGSRVHLLWNNTSGYNCVVTMKTTNIGVPTRTGTYLQLPGQTALVSAGDYRYYAGPTKAYARDKCVKWGGGTNAQWWYSGFEHC
jgi:sialidase-1